MDKKDETVKSEEQLQLEQVKLVCKKHGDITASALNLTLPSNSVVNGGKFIYCLHCLNDLLLGFQEQELLTPVQIVVPDALAEKLKEEVIAQKMKEDPNADTKLVEAVAEKTVADITEVKK